MNRPWILQPWIRITLAACGAMAGCVGFYFVSPALIAAFSKTSAVFIGTAWITVMAFALKIADVTEAPALSPEEHAELEAMARNGVKSIWRYAGCVAIATAVVLTPSLIVEARVELDPLWVMAAGAALAWVVHVVILNAAWQEEMRQFRSDLRAREREQKRAEEMRKRYLENSSAQLPDELRAEITTHNKVLEWPTNNGPH